MILVNGRAQDHLSARDRGLHFGDGVFETIAVDEGRPLCLQRHLRRLADGCLRLGMQAPEVATIEEECGRACEGAKRAVLKLMVTRGVGGRGYAPDDNAAPTRIVARYPWPNYAPRCRTDGVAVRICRTRLGRNQRLAGVKHLNRLEQVLARMEENPTQCDEGLMLDDKDNVIEGIMSNVFALRGGRLCTPDLAECGVAGIIRELVLEASKELTGHEAQVVTMSIADLSSADECFLTNSLIGIWPVRAIEGQSKRAGPVTQRLRELLGERGAIARD